MAKDGAMPETTDIVKSFKSISTPEELQRILDNATEEQVVAIITGINNGEKYWSQEQKKMQNPIPNMSRDRSITYSMYTFDVYGKEILFEPFAAFILKAVNLFSYLTLYVHDGEFGFSPVFAVRHLTADHKNPYLIKFKEKHFPKNLYADMVKILYSKENIKKHADFGLKKIESLSHYDY